MQEFASRRQRLMRQMGEGGIAIVPAAPERRRNRDVYHPYRQDSDFHYLTGFPEPEAVAVLLPGRAQGEYLLFCRERNPEMETWHGRRAGLEGACTRYGADDAFPITDLDDILPGLLENTTRVYATMGSDPAFDRRLLEWVNRVRDKARAGVTAPVEFIDLDHLLHEMRLFKSAAEIEAMRHAASASAAAHRRAMRACRPGLSELDLEAELLHEFAQHGARHAAYPSIVGAGANGCILHYTENSSRLRRGDLVLIDAGAEYDGYAADITRTFPVSGRFSRTQRAVYQLVLEAQHAALEQVRPGRHWNDPHDAAVAVLTEGLVALGLLKGRPATQLKKGGYRRFYMHRTGHWLGMDVHDVGDYKVGGTWRELEPGMVLTIEPGLYLAAGEKGVDRRFADIGIRIEDDVLVTADGHAVLTAEAPKEVAEIEALMAG
ncbi:MAG TPA: Xaa-Pro aminopeptidase [Gammaproteobacteria bacterium]